MMLMETFYKNECFIEETYVIDCSLKQNKYGARIYLFQCIASKVEEFSEKIPVASSIF